MKVYPTISIIVPVYKVEPFLQKCINSILSQTYQNLEIILVDDGSPDSCPSICDSYALKDKRVRVIHKPNGGLSSARNAGLDIAKGDYIGFVDSDDWIESTMYEEMISLMQEKDLDVAFCAANIIENGEKIETRFAYHPNGTVLSKEDVIQATIEDRYMSYAWMKLYHRRCWNGVRFPEGRLFEDVGAVYLAYSNAEKPIGFIGKGLYNYVKNPTGLTYQRKPETLYHLYLGKAEQLEYARLHCPEAVPKCEALAARFALGTYSDYYCNGFSELADAVPEVAAFLEQNRRELQSNPHMERGWHEALRLYYVSKPAFRVFYKTYVRLRGQL